MLKFLVMGVNKKNKGNLALVMTTVKTIDVFIGKSKFFFIGPNKEKLNSKMVHVTPAYELSFQNPFKICECILIILKIILYKRGFPIKTDSFKCFESVDVVINSGGDNLSGESGLYVIKTLLNNIFAILLNKPLVLFSESLGYSKNFFVTKLLNYVIRKADLIILRETFSYDYVKNILKSKDNYYLTADTVFLLERAPESILRTDLLKTTSVKPVIGFNVSPLVSYFNEDVDIVKVSFKALRSIMKLLGGTIILIPHVYGKDSDLKVLSKIYEKLNSENVILIENEYEPEELKSIIGQCDLFIGARMHATIASTSQCIPTVGIAYSHKMHGIIGEMLGLEDYVIDLKDLDSEILIEKTMAAWENRKEITEHLKRRIPEIKKMAMRNGELVKELCDSLGLT